MKQENSQKDVANMSNGVIGGLITAAVGLVVLGLVLTFGADLQSDFQSDYTTDSMAYNITGESLDATNKIATRQTLIASVIVIVAIITLLIAGFGRFFRN